MEEILHQLISSLFHYLQGLYIPGGAGFLPSTVGLNYCVVNPTKKRCDFVLTPYAFSGDNFIEEIPAELGQFESQHGAKWCCVVQGSLNATHIGGSKKQQMHGIFCCWDFPFKMHCLSWCHNTMTPVRCFNEFLFGFEVQRATNALFASQQFHNAPRERVVGRLNVAPSLMASQHIPPITCPQEIRSY